MSTPPTAAALARRYGLVGALASVAMLALVLAGSSALDQQGSKPSPYVADGRDRRVIVGPESSTPPVGPTRPPHTGSPATSPAPCPTGR